jgi:hypothetical protein
MQLSACFYTVVARRVVFDIIYYPDIVAEFSAMRNGSSGGQACSVYRGELKEFMASFL